MTRCCPSYRPERASGEETDATILVDELKQIYDYLSMITAKHTTTRISVMENIWVNYKIINENDLFNVV